MATSVDHKFNKSFYVLIFTVLLQKCNANDILGCGGFVKSHVNLDFSKIEIGLYTKQGSLKERTECAPTNGYYFLPLYEKGEYVLKVHPPAGWSFEPSQVDLVVDGSTDQCSTGQDVNFVFNGFGITGRVITAGQTQGPSGISIQLVNENGDQRDTVTSTGGDFHFTPVIPGKYIVKASHPRWKLEPAQAAVQVKEGNTALPAGVLAVKGYDVKGTVTSYGHPISGVYILLYSKGGSPKYRVEGCKTALLQGVPDAPICHSITDGSGEFSFGLVPAGEYRLLALPTPPGQQLVSFNVKPESVSFSVHHNSIYIKNAFEVTGFTVVGSVLTAAGAGADGGGLAGARVLQDGRAAAASDAAGRFTLPALQPGVYTLSFQHEKCQLEDVQLTITPAGPAASPAAVAARWRVCGAVSPPHARDVSLAAATTAVRVTPDHGGKWCTYLPPGVYSAKVDVSEQEQRDGLQFYPLTQKITVAHAPVDGVAFSQLKAELAGRVECKAAAACGAVPVTLKPLSPDGGYVGRPMHTVAKDGLYTFEEVLPGSVEVSVPTDALCWREARHNVAVTQRHAAVPAFEHAGYVLRLHSTHDTEVEYVSDKCKGVMSVERGATQQCVAEAARYTLTPRGCHRFQPPQAHATAGADQRTTVHFVAVAHAVGIKVLSPVPVDDLVLKINTDDHGTKTVGPLVPLEQPSGGYAFEHILYMADGEVRVVSVESASLLFVPSDPQQVVGRAECQAAALTLRAVRGLTVAGALRPPQADVTVTLTSDDIKLTQVTSADGKYSFGPLDASKRYSVTAEKESYVFGERGADGVIRAHRLASVSVTLRGAADDAPLQGALVSVSGGAYRRNALAGADGRLRFPALSPADYYVKPHMKEYRFAPPHATVAVQEGLAHHVAFKGERVAWSCVGRLVSLGGAGWAGAALAAAPAPAQRPACALEDATTDAAGAFRIRGLLPNCVYTLELKESAAPELRGLKLAKVSPTLEVKDNKDIENLRLVAVQPTQITDASVLVRSPNVDFYRTLRLTLAPEAAPHTPVYSAKLDPAGFSQFLNPGLMYVLPRLPADNKTYVLTLESTLSKATHTYKEEVHYFTSDGKYKSFTIDFAPKVKSSSEELRQTSLLVVPLLGALVLCYVQREALAARAAALAASLAGRPARRAPRARPDVLDRASIDYIVNTVNAAGKRVPKKKSQ